MPSAPAMATAVAVNREVWAYDRQTGQEHFVWRTSHEYGLDLNGRLRTVDCSSGSAQNSTAWRGIYGQSIKSMKPLVSPDGHRLALVIAESYDKGGQSQNARLFVADAATGQSRVELGNIVSRRGRRTARGSPLFSTAVSPSSTPRRARRWSASGCRSATRRPRTLFGRPTARACWWVYMARMGAPAIRRAITSF